MSEPRPEDERDLLAAEHALGLLVGADRAQAQARVLSDREFAAAVEAWQVRLAPLAEEAAAVAPPADLWDRIEAALGSPDATGRQIASLHRAVGKWRLFAGGAGALAASLALFVATRQPVSPPLAPSSPAFVATLASPDSGVSLAVAYDRTSRTLLVSPGALKPAAGHDHELWDIPAGAKPISLGVVRAGAPERRSLVPTLGERLRPGATLALSLEPAGGSPTGQPTGPVLATGEISSL